MSKPRFMRTMVCGWSPDGQAIGLRFQHEDGIETEVWVRTRDLPQMLFQMQEAGARASQIAAAAPGGVQVLTALKVAQFTVGDSAEGVSFLGIAFQSGLQIHMEMGDQTVDALSGALSHLRQTKPSATKH